VRTFDEDLDDCIDMNHTAERNSRMLFFNLRWLATNECVLLFCGTSVVHDDARLLSI